MVYYGLQQATQMLRIGEILEDRFVSKQKRAVVKLQTP